MSTKDSGMDYVGEESAAVAPRVWSQYQDAFFNFVANGEGNGMLIAVAGSGKTTTGVEAVKRLPRGRSHIYLAFNKSIATELSARGVNGKTFHSLCYSVVTKFKNTRNVEANKLRILVDEMLGDGEKRLYAQFITRLVGLGRNAGIGCLCQDLPEVWQALADHHDLELDNDAADPKRAIELAQKLLTLSNESPMVDFDDLLYLAVKEGLSLPKFDDIFVDEFQDTNSIQLAIIRKLMREGSRFYGIGDPAQSIYGFRGADSNAMNRGKEEFACTELPLTVSYRCPKSVVEYAREWVEHIEAAPNAPEGIVDNLDESWTVSIFKANDLVVCRTTAPLISIAYQMLRAKMPVRVMGRDIGEGLKSLVKKMNAKGIDHLQEKLSAWAEREAEKCIAKRQEAKAEAIRDKADALFCLIDGLPETDRTVPASLAVIDSLFAEKVGATILATIHKAKGLEADRVYWLNSSKCPAAWARQPWQQEQERNLCYVAVTRAKSELMLIEEPKNGRQRQREAA
jgi:DNA helicase II / ATP-dependent DNA helicase PcrA